MQAKPKPFTGKSTSIDLPFIHYTLTHFFIMKHPKITYQQIRHYMSKNGYVPSFRRGNKDAFYNHRNQSHVMIPFGLESYTREDIITAFEADGATIRPPEIEYFRLRVFLYEFELTNASN